MSHHDLVLVASRPAHVALGVQALSGHLARYRQHALSPKLEVKVPAHIHLPLLSHIRIHGPALDYVGLFLLAILSGIGINGFGEAALITAGVYVSHHHISVTPVLLIAGAGGFIGGVIGFLVGKHGGRFLFTASGPLAKLRAKMLKRSEEIYLHHDLLAILITPSWAAGMHRVRWLRFLPLNLLSASLWAGVLGLGAYYLGSHITSDWSSEITWILAAVIAIVVIYHFVQRALRAPSRS